MRYTLEELKEYHALLEAIQALESSLMGGETDKQCPKCEARKRGVAKAAEEGRGGQVWTEERRRAQSARMRGNKVWAGEPHPDILDIALAPLPEGATGRRRVKRDYRCSICNGEGHNAATCDTLVEEDFA
jgi:hypothetical protein